MTNLIRVEIIRLLTRKRIYLLLFFLLFICLYTLISREIKFVELKNDVMTQFFRTFYPLCLLLPLFVGGSVGDSVAEDRSQNYLPYVLVRAKSKSKYLLSKMIGMTLVSASFMALIVLSLFLVNAVKFDFTVNKSAWESQFFLDHPILSAILIMFSFAWACGAYSAFCVFISQWVKRPYLVACSPFLFTLLGLLAMPNFLSFMNPYKYLALSSPWLDFSSIFLYWTGWMLLFGVLSVYNFGRENL